MIANVLEPTGETSGRRNRGHLATCLQVAGVIAVVAVMAACGAGAPSATPDPIQTGDCATVTGPDNDLTLTELPCDDPKAQYRVDLRRGIADVPCPSKSDVKVASHVTVDGWYCLSSIR
jgi:hypothetical protein